MARPGALVKLMRPHQWVKNAFVLVGLVFGHGWLDHEIILSAAALFAAFCLASSGVYALNDVMDRESDRAHPEKRERPVAKGLVPAGGALLFSALLSALGLLLAWRVSAMAALITACYLLVNVGYSLGLKNVVVLDVFLIASGFMLRILAGTLGLGIAPSRWLLLCGLLITVFLGFAKRRAELLAQSQAMNKQGRASPSLPSTLALYRPAMLDRMIGVSAVGAALTYALYTVDADTVALHGTDKLVYTLPFVLYGISRYLFVLYRRGGGADPSLELLRDPHLLLAAAAWVATVLWLIA